jgi:DNA mismatch repair protein MutL
MSRIRLLSEAVASQVAAGEVVERPASVVKELVENSIDAGGTRIEVAIRRGGSSQITVTDNGCGMDRDDALLCLERHATSKIRTADDLVSVATLGFRGEALPSIASVSRFRLATREAGALAGTEVIVSGGRIEAVRDSGEAPGTTIEVRSLFYNVPARRKFLRAETTESSHVEHQMLLQAIGHSAIGFTLGKDGRTIYQLPRAPSLRDRIRDLCGSELAGELVEVGAEPVGGIRLGGFIGKPGASRSSRSGQIVFVNGRAVESGTIHFGLREGYHTALMKGRYPVTFLFIEMDAALVDVNVHPAKREVRFRDPMAVRNAVAEGVRLALESTRGTWSSSFSAPASPPPAADGGAAATAQAPSTPQPIPVSEQIALRHDWSSLPRVSPPIGPAIPDRTATGDRSPLPQSAPENHPAAAAPSAPVPAPPSRSAPPPEGAPAAGARSPEEFRILGVLGRLYVLMENASGLVLVDQHAAHERILFEQLRRRMEAEGVPSQRLLIPLTLQLPPKDADWLGQNAATLEKMGVLIEPFGPGTFKIDALPQFMKSDEPVQLMRDIIDELRETSATVSKLRLGEDVIATTVCRHAVKAHDLLRDAELLQLIRDLLACELPYCCPHGRPTMIQITYAELEKKFGRKV